MLLKEDFNLLSYYVPKDSLDIVNDALFSVGAGKIGKYEKCCWFTEGVGQFSPLDGSNPSLGKVGEIEKVVEVKCDIMILKINLEVIIKTLIQAHPYESPVFYVSSALMPLSYIDIK